MRRLAHAAALASLVLATAAFAQPVAAVREEAARQVQPFLATAKDLVEIESGSSDREGLDRMTERVAAGFRALRGEVEVIEPPQGGAKMVRATFKGTGTKSVLMLAHMDTVYPRGSLARQPFRVEGDRAYGLGISDDKQGIAAIEGAIAILQRVGFRGYGRITVLVNGDEEIGSPASKDLIARLGAEHDATLSFEASSATFDRVSMVTTGVGAIVMKVHGKASHAGSSAAAGVNALYELAHQINQMRDLTDPGRGVRVSWTLARAGVVSNMIPPEAEATADVRVLRTDAYEGLEATVRERVRNQLLPQARIDLEFHRGRPPLQATPAARALGEHARGIYAEIGKALKVNDDTPYGGTDAAYAGLRTRSPVLEHWGVHGYGAHSSNAEYIVVSSIEGRLYLAARTIMDIAADKVRY